MGSKERVFSPLPTDVSLEELVPNDHFYRRLEERLDLSFVRELVAPLYSDGGRPSVDPVVFFKLQLVMFFEDLRSERQLMRVVSNRLSLRWYLGYDLHEPLPDHSSLTRIRERYGLGIFRTFFDRIVEMCVEVKGYYGLEAYKKAMRKRKVWIEPMFAEVKQWHGMERVRLRTLERVNTEVLVTAAGQNVKRLLAFGPRRPRRAAQAAALRLPGGRCLPPVRRCSAAQRGVSQHAARNGTATRNPRTRGLRSTRPRDQNRLRCAWRAPGPAHRISS